MIIHYMKYPNGIVFTRIINVLVHYSHCNLILVITEEHGYMFIPEDVERPCLRNTHIQSDMIQLLYRCCHMFHAFANWPRKEFEIFTERPQIVGRNFEIIARFCSSGHIQTKNTCHCLASSQTPDILGFLRRVTCNY
jgi:hypothetical protein